MFYPDSCSNGFGGTKQTGKNLFFPEHIPGLLEEAPSVAGF